MHCARVPHTPGRPLANCCRSLLDSNQRPTLSKWPAQAKRKPSEAPVHPASPSTTGQCAPDGHKPGPELQLSGAAAEGVRVGRKGFRV